MKRLGIGIFCLFALYLLSGCASLRESSAHLYENLFLGLHHKTSQPESKGPEVCLLDPVASTAPETPAPAISSAKDPIAELPEMVHDFGKVSEEGELVHKFSVKNVGKSVLNIKKVVPG
jgi:hypothetical protein